MCAGRFRLVSSCLQFEEKSISAVVLLHRLLGHHALGDKDIYQALQGFHVLLGQQIIVHGDSDEMNEATVQLQVSVDVPEWVVPMVVVEMCIAAKHLFDDAFDILVVLLREAGCLADPVILKG